MKVKELQKMMEYKLEHNIDLRDTAIHFDIGINRLRTLLHDNGINIPKRRVTRDDETIAKITKANLITKNSPKLKYDWKFEYDNFIKSNNVDKSVGVRQYCKSRGYHERYLREYIRNNNLYQPRGIPKRTKEWKDNISKSAKGVVKNPNGSNGKLRGIRLSKEHRNKIQSGLVKHHYDLDLETWKSITDDRVLYYKEVWRITKQQKLELLENLEKRGNSGIDGAYQLDHIYPISIGFMNNIPPEVIGDISNLQMLPWHENRIKGNGVIE